MTAGEYLLSISGLDTGTAAQCMQTVTVGEGSLSPADKAAIAIAVAAKIAASPSTLTVPKFLGLK